jgi:hypothetical protein
MAVGEGKWKPQMELELHGNLFFENFKITISKFQLKQNKNARCK